MNLPHNLKTMLFVAFFLNFPAISCPTFSSMRIELAGEFEKKITQKSIVSNCEIGS